MILGMDVWAGYGEIDFTVARHGGGLEFVIIKGAVGNDPHLDDPMFARYAEDSKNAGLVRGSYGFFYGLPAGSKYPLGRSGAEQAKRHWAYTKELGGELGTLPPSLDLEWPAHFERADKSDPKSALADLWKKWFTSPDIIVDGALEWLETMHGLCGRLPICYIYPDMASNLAGAANFSELAKYPLWIASYAKRDSNLYLPPEDARPTIPKPWSDFAIWQFSADGSPVYISGVPRSPVDRDCVKDASVLAGLAGITEAKLATDFDIVHPQQDDPGGRN